MRTLAEPGLRWCQHRVASSAQDQRDLAPAPTAVPSATHEHVSLALHPNFNASVWRGLGLSVFFSGTEGCQSTLPASGPPMIAIRSASGASVRLLKPRRRSGVQRL